MVAETPAILVPGGGPPRVSTNASLATKPHIPTAKQNTNPHGNDQENKESPTDVDNAPPANGPTARPTDSIVLTKQDYDALMARLTRQEKDLGQVTQSLVKTRLREYHKEADERLKDKVIVTFTGKNYSSWRSIVLEDAQTIGAMSLLVEKQIMPPTGLSELEQGKWKIQNSIMFTRIFRSLSNKVRIALGFIDTWSAANLFAQITAVYGVSLAEERLIVLRNLRDLRVENGDYLTYQQRFRTYTRRYQALGKGVEDVFHDLFLLGLGDYQKEFVKSKLDDFYATGQGRIKNLNIEDLMGQLERRAS